MMQSVLTHKMPAWLSCGGPDNDVAISTRVRLARNLAHHRFPLRASLFERTQVFEEVTDVFRATAECGSYSAVSFGLIDKRQQELFVEERLATGELASGDGGHGIIHDESRRISVMVNEEDHLRLQGLDAGLRPRELWAVLDAIDDTVGTRLDFAFDNRKGFLTSCPADAGTGLRVSALMHLPGLVLTRSIEGVLQRASSAGVSTRGFFGGNPPEAGNLFQLSKCAAMGAGEAEFVDDAAGVLKNVVEFERKARERLLAERRRELSDTILGSWGSLREAAFLGVDEFLNLSSALRTGIECNLFDKCTIDGLNRLTLFVLPAHLQTWCRKSLTRDECREARAELVKTYFAQSAKDVT
jgi:protein arginine kinase